MQKDICGAIKKKDNTECKNKPMKNGKCRFHGGLSTGPKDKEKHSESLKGNKNALSTGEYESISFDTLLEDEKELYGYAPNDTGKVLWGDMRLLLVRQRRISQLHTIAYSEVKKDYDRISQLENALSRINSRILELAREIREIDASKPMDQMGEGTPIHQLTEILGGSRNIRIKELELVERENRLSEREHRLEQREG